MLKCTIVHNTILWHLGRNIQRVIMCYSKPLKEHMKMSFIFAASSIFGVFDDATFLQFTNTSYLTIEITYFLTKICHINHISFHFLKNYEICSISIYYNYSSTCAFSDYHNIWWDYYLINLTPYWMFPLSTVMIHMLLYIPLFNVYY